MIAVVLNLRDFAVMAQTIGVGFRNAKFEEISKPDIPESVLPTIHFFSFFLSHVQFWSHYYI